MGASVGPQLLLTQHHEGLCLLLHPSGGGFRPSPTRRPRSRGSPCGPCCGSPGRRSPRRPRSCPPCGSPCHHPRGPCHCPPCGPRHHPCGPRCCSPCCSQCGSCGGCSSVSSGKCIDITQVILANRDWSKLDQDRSGALS